LKISSLPRRAILRLSLGLAGTLSLWGLVRFLSYRERKTSVGKIVLDVPESYFPGSVTQVPEARAWIIRDQVGLYAVSATCTHLGCLLISNGLQFSCPCHGSEFDLNGRILVGPADIPLPHFELTRSSGNLLVLDTEKNVPRDQRLDVGMS
jgi:cytochrome b6-f complex iron-sulfur subunit